MPFRLCRLGRTNCRFVVASLTLTRCCPLRGFSAPYDDINNPRAQGDQNNKYPLVSEMEYIMYKIGPKNGPLMPLKLENLSNNLKAFFCVENSSKGRTLGLDIELPEPSEWVPEHSVLYTCGIGIRGSSKLMARNFGYGSPWTHPSPIF